MKLLPTEERTRASLHTDGNASVACSLNAQNTLVSRAIPQPGGSFRSIGTLLTASMGLMLGLAGCTAAVEGETASGVESESSNDPNSSCEDDLGSLTCTANVFGFDVEPELVFEDTCQVITYLTDDSFPGQGIGGGAHENICGSEPGRATLTCTYDSSEATVTWRCPEYVYTCTSQHEDIENRAGYELADLESAMNAICRQASTFDPQPTCYFHPKGWAPAGFESQEYRCLEEREIILAADIELESGVSRIVFSEPPGGARGEGTLFLFDSGDNLVATRGFDLANPSSFEVCVTPKEKERYRLVATAMLPVGEEMPNYHVTVMFDPESEESDCLTRE